MNSYQGSCPVPLPSGSTDLQCSGSDFEKLVEPVLVRQLKPNLITGRRVEPSATTGPPAHCVAICTVDVVQDLERLLPTVGYFTDMVIHLICDATSQTIAKELASLLGISDRLHCLPWLTPENMALAESKLKRITIQHSYWKPGPIWWKLEGTRRVLEMLKGQSCLFLDSDIVFCNEFRNTSFEHVDVVLSPFYWPDPDQMVPPRPGSKNYVHISIRDGVLNAGYAWVTKPDVMDLWKELYEAGVGGFYEQYVMGYLCQKFCVDWFDARHNFGQWRSQIPPPNTISLHMHASTKHYRPSALAVSERAASATLFATRMLRERVLGC
jgi:hypothetical protein